RRTPTSPATSRTDLSPTTETARGRTRTGSTDGTTREPAPTPSGAPVPMDRVPIDRSDLLPTVSKPARQPTEALARATPAADPVRGPSVPEWRSTPAPASPRAHPLPGRSWTGNSAPATTDARSSAGSRRPAA